jgi:hypothetical protein
MFWEQEFGISSIDQRRKKPIEAISEVLEFLKD